MKTDESGNDSEATVGDLAMLVARLIHQLRYHDKDNPVAEKAMDYLRRKNLHGPILRDIIR